MPPRTFFQPHASGFQARDERRFVCTRIRRKRSRSHHGPNLEQYRKLAKELVKACRSGGGTAIRGWATQWIDRLAANASIERLEAFARRQFGGKCSVTGAQFVIARAHGFASWPKFAGHLEALQDETSTVAAFEAAVGAIVRGDIKTLNRLLRANPRLARARSTREHRATLLHYVSANGVEGYRQLSPANSGEIAEVLIAAGADVNATTDVYGGKCTALGLVATSSPPAAAGVQREVIDILLKHGARTDLRGSVGHDSLLVRGCLANGQAEAAEYLASRGAPLDLESAAGLGRVEEVTRLAADAVQNEILAAFSMACAYGRAAVIDYFVTRCAVGVGTTLKSHGDGHTGLHVAAFHGQLEAVNVLLRLGASVHAIDKTWKTPPLTWALTGWQRSGHGGRYYDVVAALVTAGARVTPDLVEWDKVQADPEMLAALSRRT